MGDVRKIIQEELTKLVNENDFIKKHPIFSNPMKAAEYAMEWQDKAAKMNKFYWQVSNILGIIDMSPEEKVSKIQELMPHYGWL